MDVVRMRGDYEQKHLDKILDRLAKLQLLKAMAISNADKETELKASIRLEEVKREYNFYKKGYGL